MAFEIANIDSSADNAAEPSRPRKFLLRHASFMVGSLTILLLGLAWEFARPLGLPGLSRLPAPTAIVAASAELLHSPMFWEACYKSTLRIISGFCLAQIVGIPLGFIMATNRTIFNSAFPVAESLRPIPPVAWIPISIIFWPTREASTIFIVFLGAFWIVLLNTIGGVSTIDQTYRRAALSLGSSRGHLLRYIIFPATLPTIVTGMVISMGICWEMVVAAEMIAGDTGLGYLLWQSFEISATAQVLVCMFTIGLAGFLSSAAIRKLGRLLTTWSPNE
jgi:NitT/TauT family transport system permease protein